MTIEPEDIITNEEDVNQSFTAGETEILAKLESLQEQLDELTEKVNNINLSDNDGLSIERY